MGTRVIEQPVVPQERWEAIRRMVEKLVAGYAPLKVILFGSHVRGHPLPDSDVDLLIVKETDECFLDRWMTVRRLLSDPKRTFALEALVLTPEEIARRQAVGDQFVEKILAEGKVLYAA